MKKRLIFIPIISFAGVLVSCGGTNVPSYSTPAHVYHVDFVSNGGSFVPSLTTDVIAESPITERGGFSFAGWFADSSLETSPISFPYTLSSDVTLYAKWTESPVEYRVRFETYGGTPVEDFVGTYIMECPFTEKLGNVFKGWYESEERTGKPVPFPYDVNCDLVLHAKWEPIERIPDGENLVNVKVGAMSNQTYWTAEYCENSLLITVNVVDKYVFTGAGNAAFNDNVEILVSPSTDLVSGYLPTFTYRCLVDASSNGFIEQAASYTNFVRMSMVPSGFNMASEPATLESDGFDGYKSFFVLPYSMFGLSASEALGNISIAPASRNSNSPSSTDFAYSPRSGWYDSWSFLQCNKDGSFGRSKGNINVLFGGDRIFSRPCFESKISALSSMSGFAQHADFTKTTKVLEDYRRLLQEDHAKWFAGYKPKKMVLALASEDLEYGEDTLDNVKNAATNLLEIVLEQSPETEVFLVSVNPLNGLDHYFDNVVEFNEHLSSLSAEHEKVSYIDTFSTFADIENKKAISSYYKDAVTLTDAGYVAYTDIIFSAIGF